MDSVVSKLKIALRFQETFEVGDAKRRVRYSPKPESKEIQNALLEFGLAGGRHSVVLYTTSLQFIQKTFTECSSVRSILDSYSDIVYEERDVSLFSGFRQQLRNTASGTSLPPKLYIDGRCVGGAEEVLRLHEEGHLRGLLAGNKISENTSKRACKGCGGVRFVTCRDCRGTRRRREGYGDGECTKCDEKGLVFCYVCKFEIEIS